MNKKHREKIKLFITGEHQLIKVEGVMKLGSLHLVIIPVLVKSGKKHQWMLKLMLESGLMKEIFSWFQSLSAKRTY